MVVDKGVVKEQMLLQMLKDAGCCPEGGDAPHLQAEVGDLCRGSPQLSSDLAGVVLRWGRMDEVLWCPGGGGVEREEGEEAAVRAGVGRVRTG